MKRMKRTIALISALALMMSCLGTASAASEAAPESSPTLTGYYVVLDPGDSEGELDISFLVTATKWAESLGVSYIEIHETSDGSLVKTIRGTTSNGLKSEGFSFTNTYTYDGAISGMYYYAIVAIYAQVDGVVDSRTLRTVSVQAP